MLLQVMVGLSQAVQQSRSHVIARVDIRWVTYGIRDTITHEVRTFRRHFGLWIGVCNMRRD